MGIGIQARIESALPRSHFKNPQIPSIHHPSVHEPMNSDLPESSGTEPDASNREGISASGAAPSRGQSPGVKRPAGADRAQAELGASLPQARGAVRGDGPVPPPLGASQRPVYASTELAPVSLPALPRGRATTPFFSKVWFVLAVVIPSLTGVLYYGVFASRQYVSEFRFSVRSATTSASVTPGATSVVTSLINGSGGGMDLVDNYTVTDYIVSPQALSDVSQTLDLRAMYGTGEADWWARFNPHRSQEKFLSYWQDMVYSTYDPATGLAIVQVRAFNAADAFAISSKLMELSEKLINDISLRARTDSVRFARDEVTRVEQQVADARAHLAKLRNNNAVIDPMGGVVASNNQQEATLRATITQIETQISALNEQLHNPDAPAIRVLNSQLAATRKQLAAVKSAAYQSFQGDPMLSRTVGDFEAVNVELTTDEQILAGVLANLQTAYATANAQQLYLQPYQKPTRPSSGTYPARIESILIVIGCSLLLWGTGLLVFNAINEHGA
jgi:capsular polysaccharide transport system permease protein